MIIPSPSSTCHIVRCFVSGIWLLCPTPTLCKSDQSCTETLSGTRGYLFKAEACLNLPDSFGGLKLAGNDPYKPSNGWFPLFGNPQNRFISTGTLSHQQALDEVSIIETKHLMEMADQDKDGTISAPLRREISEHEGTKGRKAVFLFFCFFIFYFIFRLAGWLGNIN